MAGQILLTMKGICKYFPGVRALENVDFTLRAGEIHALMGENGAGKSTLIKVLTGVHIKDGGTIELDGHEIARPARWRHRKTISQPYIRRSTFVRT